MRPEDKFKPPRRRARPIPGQMTFTPEDSEYLVGKAWPNRTEGQRHIDSYAHDMIIGKWMEGVSIICFDWDGRLTNGKHRLLACIKSGKSFNSFIAWGVSKEDCLHALDRQANRTDAQYLQFKEHKYATMISASAKVLNRVRRNQLKNSISYKRRSRTDLLNISALEAYIDRWSYLDRAVADYSSLDHATGGILPSSTALGIGAALFHDLNMPAETIFKFFEEVYTGASRASVINKLRRILIKGINNKVHDIGATGKILATLKCWNYWVTGTPITNFVIARSQLDFPIMCKPGDDPRKMRSPKSDERHAVKRKKRGKKE